MKKHENKIGVLEIVTKLKNYALILQNMVVVPPKLLDSDASIYVSIKSKCIHHQGTIPLSRVRALIYIKNTRWGFWYPFSFGSLRVSIVRNPNILISKFKAFFLS